MDCHEGWTAMLAYRARRGIEEKYRSEEEIESKQQTPINKIMQSPKSRYGTSESSSAADMQREKFQ